MDDEEQEMDRLLTRAFQETFTLSQQREEEFWREFAGARLPEKQGWLSFRIAMTQIDRRLEQATRWANWAAPQPTTL